jgi:hypothetical protein
VSAPRRARLARYARWQLADYLVERGVSTAILGAVIVLAPVVLGGPAARAAAPLLLAATIGNLGLLGTLFALNGISSTDRQRGYFRFLFSKPVSVPRFYLQDFLLRFAGLLAITLVLLGAFAVLAGVAFPVWAVAHVALTFMLVGGVGFLLSALTHHDGLALVGVYVGATLVRTAGAVLGWLGRGAAATFEIVGTVLPPFHLLDAVRTALATGTAPRMGDLVWVLAYGLGCFAAGLLVLRHRPLST